MVEDLGVGLVPGSLVRRAEAEGYSRAEEGLLADGACAGVRWDHRINESSVGLDRTGPSALKMEVAVVVVAAAAAPFDPRG